MAFTRRCYKSRFMIIKKVQVTRKDELQCSSSGVRPCSTYTLLFPMVHVTAMVDIDHQNNKNIVLYIANDAVISHAIPP